jgi:hypothetical protein
MRGGTTCSDNWAQTLGIAENTADRRTTERLRLSQALIGH